MHYYEKNTCYQIRKLGENGLVSEHMGPDESEPRAYKNQ
jgi:hypothetical protein